jgi:hypothetical protein
VSDHPVCGAKVGFAEIFLMPQTPLLTSTHNLAAASATNSKEVGEYGFTENKVLTAYFLERRGLGFAVYFPNQFWT